MFTYLFNRFLRRVFSLLRADRILYICSSGLKIWVLLVQDTFHLPPVILAVVSIYLITLTTVPQIPFWCFARSLALDSPHLLTTTSVPKLIFLTPTSAAEKRGYFRFRILANHVAFFFISLVTECKHLLPFTLTHILYFLRQAVKNWPILLYRF